MAHIEQTKMSHTDKRALDAIAHILNEYYEGTSWVNDTFAAITNAVQSTGRKIIKPNRP